MLTPLSSPPADRFTICLPIVLKEEMADPGNWSNIRNLSVDPVRTFCGIKETEFWAWLDLHGLKRVPVQFMTQSEGYAIYRANYWLPYCPHLPVGLDLPFFDEGVNAGIRESIRILQVALGVQNDGIWGPITASAVAKITNLPAQAIRKTIEAFTARRLVVYQQIVEANPADGKYKPGWNNRARMIGIAAASMVA